MNAQWHSAMFKAANAWLVMDDTNRYVTKIPFSFSHQALRSPLTSYLICRIHTPYERLNVKGKVEALFT